MFLSCFLLIFLILRVLVICSDERRARVGETHALNGLGLLLVGLPLLAHGRHSRPLLLHWRYSARRMCANQTVACTTLSSLICCTSARVACTCASSALRASHELPFRTTMLLNRLSRQSTDAWQIKCLKLNLNFLKTLCCWLRALQADRASRRAARGAQSDRHHQATQVCTHFVETSFQTRPDLGSPRTARGVSGMVLEQIGRRAKID